MTNPEQRTPAAHVPKLAALLSSAGISNGERAAFKRMALNGPTPLALHRLLLTHVDEDWQGEYWLSDWRTLICALAIQRGGEHGGYQPDTSLGKALAQASFSEMRFERLLATSGDTLRALSLRAARQVATKSIACDWRMLASLLFARNPEHRERVNMTIARDFYHTLDAINLTTNQE